MIRLLKIELKKILPYRTFWVLTGLYFLLLSLFFMGLRGVLSGIKINQPKQPLNIADKFNIPLYDFPDIWHNLAFVAGFFKIILAIVILILITNEFSYKTIRQHIITGFSRLDFLLAKLGLIFSLSVGVTVFIFLLGLIIGLFNSGVTEIHLMVGKLEFVLVYFLEVFSYLIFALFIGTLVKKSGLSIGLLLLYTVIIEPIIGYILPDVISPYMPLSSISNLIQVPNNSLMSLFGLHFQNYISAIDVSIAIAYAFVFIAAIYWLLKKRDL